VTEKAIIERMQKRNGHLEQLDSSTTSQKVVDMEIDLYVTPVHITPQRPLLSLHSDNRRDAPCLALSQRSPPKTL